MGLDSYMESNDSVHSGSRNTNNSSNDKPNSQVYKKSVLNDDSPYLTVVFDIETTSVHCYEGRYAFPRNCRTTEERIIYVIDDKEDYERVDSVSRNYTGESIQDVFMDEPQKARDLCNRFIYSDKDTKHAMCDVCTESIHLERDDYCMALGGITHAEHTVEQVVDALGEDEQ